MFCNSSCPKALPLFLSLALLGLAPSGSTQTQSRISANIDGLQGNGLSGLPCVTPDGRFTAFFSEATNLVPGDTNRVRDVFVFDRQSFSIERVSVSSTGVQGNGKSSRPAISADGRYVSFYSDSTNLVLGDTNRVRDIFVHDRLTGQTVRVSVRANGLQGGGLSTRPSISADGRFVAFASDAANLVAGDTNGVRDVFLHDRDTDLDGIFDEPGAIRTALLSRGTSGVLGNGASSIPRVSADGGQVAYRSVASNLVPQDTNGGRDVFVRDVSLGTTVRVSVSSGGVQGNADSSRPTISADGRTIAFYSDANNLVPGDTNQHCAVDPFGQITCGPASDCFLRDRDTDGNGVFDEVGGVATVRISTSTSGLQANDWSQAPVISADGRFVTFWTGATNLFPGDTNGSLDIVLRDRDADGNGIMDEVGGVSTTLVSSSARGVLGNLDSLRGAVSNGGRFIAFSSMASNLVPGDSNGVDDIFVRGTCSVTRFGSSTQACAGPELIDLPFCITAGLAGRFTCSNVPPLSSGFLVLGLASNPTGSLVAGVTTFIDLNASIYVFPATSDALGRGRGNLAPAPLTAAGIPFTCQFLWFNTPTCPGIGTFSASNAISTNL